MRPFRDRAAAFGLSAAAAAATVGTAHAATFEIDPAHSDVVFSLDHLGYSKVFGSFGEVGGRFAFDPEKPEAASVTLTIRAASVDTNHKKRDEHLRSPDFLNAREFPEITFESTAVAVTGKNTAEVTGDLTLHGQTHPVTLNVTFNKIAPHPLPQYDDVLTAGFSARGTIQRSRWGVGKFAPAIGDAMKLYIEVEGHAADG
jgi:polyisoprenoid-binding protein YceI